MYGQPRSLATLFFTEMWERFSFYGMRALLTLYMTIQLFENLQDPLKKNTAFGIYAAYGALVYATPFLGGIIADRFLGYRRAVWLGAIFMAIGHFIMAVETEFWLYIALAFLIVGNGYFKLNMSSIVGGLYGEDDTRRDGGFTIFYMGINLGAMLAPLACGYLGQNYGWQYGFGLAGLGMLLGLVVFGVGQNGLGENGSAPDSGLLTKKPLGLIPVEYLIYALSLASVAAFAFLVRNYELMTYVLTPFSLGVIAILLFKAFKSSDVERDRMFVILILLFFITLFWAFFEQAGSSITLFTNDNVDRMIGSYSLPASLFQSVNPFFILLLAPFFSFLWSMLARRGREPSTPLKFALGLFLLGVGFIALYWGNNFISFREIAVQGSHETILLRAATVPVLFLLLGYMLHTMGELCLSPIGLSMVTKLAPKSIAAMVMGAWFLSSAMAHHLGGAIAKLTAETEYVMPIEAAAKAFGSEMSPDIEAGMSKLEIQLLAKGDICGRSLSNVLVAAEVNAIFPSSTNNTVELSRIYSAGDALIFQMCDNADKTAVYAAEAGYFTKEELFAASVAEKHSLANLLQYNKIFLSLGIIAIVFSVILGALVPLIRKLMHGVH